MSFKKFPISILALLLPLFSTAQVVVFEDDFSYSEDSIGYGSRFFNTIESGAGGMERITNNSNKSVREYMEANKWTVDRDNTNIYTGDGCLRIGDTDGNDGQLISLPLGEKVHGSLTMKLRVAAWNQQKTCTLTVTVKDGGGRVSGNDGIYEIISKARDQKDVYKEHTLKITSSATSNTRISIKGDCFFIDDVVITADYIPLTISEYGYATLYCPTSALTVPNGVTAHTFHMDGDKAVAGVEYKTIPAGEPVIVKGNGGYYFFEKATSTANRDPENILTGVDKDTTLVGEGHYYLSHAKGGNTVGFYPVAEDGGTVIPAGKCYVRCSGGDTMSKRAFLFSEAFSTDIGHAETDNVAETYRTIGGIRLKGKPSKPGLYLLGNRKTIVR